MGPLLQYNALRSEQTGSRLRAGPRGPLKILTLSQTGVSFRSGVGLERTSRRRRSSPAPAREPSIGSQRTKRTHCCSNSRSPHDGAVEFIGAEQVLADLQRKTIGKGIANIIPFIIGVVAILPIVVVINGAIFLCLSPIFMLRFILIAS